MMSVIITGQLIGPGRAHAGPWAVQTSLSISEQYDDNVFLSSGPDDPNIPERSDLVTTLSPAVTISRTGERLTFTANYTPGLQLYSKFSKLNNLSHTGQINLTVVGLGRGFLQQAKLDIREAASYSKQQADSQLDGEPLGADSIRTRRTDTWRNSLSATLTLPFTASFSGAVSYTNRITIFEDSALIDTMGHNMSVNLKKQLTNRTIVNTAYSFQLFEFDSDRQVNHALSTGITSTPTPALTVGLSAGASYSPDGDHVVPIGSATVTTQFQSVSMSANVSYSQVGDQTALTGSATVTKQFQYTSASVSYSRDVSSAGGGFFRDLATSQSTGITLTRAMGERANVSLSSEYRDVRSRTQTGVTRSFSVATAINYVLTSWLRATAAYHHFAQRTFISESASVPGEPVPDFRNNRVTLTFTGTWGTPPL